MNFDDHWTNNYFLTHLYTWLQLTLKWNAILIHEKYLFHFKIKMSFKNIHQFTFQLLWHIIHILISCKICVLIKTFIKLSYFTFISQILTTFYMKAVSSNHVHIAYWHENVVSLILNYLKYLLTWLSTNTIYLKNCEIYKFITSCFYFKHS